MKNQIKAIMKSKGFVFIGSVAGLPSVRPVYSGAPVRVYPKMLIFKKPGKVSYYGIMIIPKAKGGGLMVYNMVPGGLYYRPRHISHPVSGCRKISTYVLRMMSL